MNHIDLLRNHLRYFNLIIGILMIIILSLNLEIIVHSKRDLFSKNDDFVQPSFKIDSQCEKCNEDSFKTLTRFCVEGALLAAFLSFFSFLLAYKYDIFEKNYKWFIPVCLIESFITALYFVFTSIQKLPDTCREDEIKLKCDADFQYVFEYKLIPMSVIMLILIPQFIFRSIVILVIKCSNRNKLKSIKRRSFRNKTFPSDLRPINESMTELDNTSYREVPIDCPQIYSQESLVLKLEDNYNISRPNISNAISRRILNRNSSLSTIAEEKTLSSCTTAITTPGSSIESQNENDKDQHQSQYNTTALLVNDFLIDFSSHFTFINDVHNVFSIKRTRDGEFSRNIAIRFKSHDNVNNISSGSSSGYNTSPNKSNLALDDSKLLSVTTDSNNNNLKLNEEKFRFVKHLKNRLETKRGKSFGSVESSISQSSLSSVINSPICKLKRRNSYFNRQRNFSKRAIDFDKFKLAFNNYVDNNNNKNLSHVILIRAENNSHNNSISSSNTNNNHNESISSGCDDDKKRTSNVSNFRTELETNKSYLEPSHIVVKSDVEPAYF